VAEECLQQIVLEIDVPVYALGISTELILFSRHYRRRSSFLYLVYTQQQAF